MVKWKFDLYKLWNTNLCFPVRLFSSITEVYFVDIVSIFSLGTATDDIAENVKKYRGGETYIADNNGNIRQMLALVDLHFVLKLSHFEHHNYLIQF